MRLCIRAFPHRFRWSSVSATSNAARFGIGESNYPPAKPGALRVLAAQSGWAGTLTRPRNWSHLKVASLAGGDDAATDLRPEVLTPRELPQHEGIPSTPVRQP